MPPRPKFTREEIIETALGIVSEKGFEALTSRELASALGSSARPVFTVFRNMEELCSEVRKAAMDLFDEYLRYAEGSFPEFKNIGIQMIKFASEHPNLFRMLFVNESLASPSFDELIKKFGIMPEMCIKMIMRDHSFNEEEAGVIFRHLWIFAYGICVLVSTNVCCFSETEISGMLSKVFLGIYLQVKQ